MNDSVLDRLTPARWLQPDPTLAVFVKLSHVDGTVLAMTPDDWSEVWRHSSIDAPVPRDIVRMFEQARACLAYGFFYYPLYALGIEQLLRVADAALGVKCEAAGGRGRVRALPEADRLVRRARRPADLRPRSLACAAEWPQRGDASHAADAAHARGRTAAPRGHRVRDHVALRCSEHSCIRAGLVRLPAAIRRACGAALGRGAPTGAGACD